MAVSDIAAHEYTLDARAGCPGPILHHLSDMSAEQLRAAVRQLAYVIRDQAEQIDRMAEQIEYGAEEEKV